jgi:aryl-alcohol dehydrogenase-like predicted oxidoreductase
MVVASMLRLEHLRANVAAMERSRFSEEEIRWLRRAIAETRA